MTSGRFPRSLRSRIPALRIPPVHFLSHYLRAVTSLIVTLFVVTKSEPCVFAGVQIVQQTRGTPSCRTR